jgi:predicted amidohydrolase YtcJ
MLLCRIFGPSPIFASDDTGADLVLIHGRILTVDARDSVAQAVAVRRGVIVKVGTDAEVLAFAGKGPGVRVIDLQAFRRARSGI